MALNPKWIPMHWPCGLLPANRLAARQSLTPEMKQTFAAWTEPNSLELLQGIPVNCLVIPWAEGTQDDKSHQESLAPLLGAGRDRGISFVGTIHGKQDAVAGISSGMQAGLAAFMVESLEDLPEDAPLILRTPRSGVPWESVTPIYCLTENLWPKLGLDTVQDGDLANAGPTGVPWVNSNGWLSLLGSELRTGKNLWLEYDPPESSDLDHPAGYTLAISDACAYGSHWVLSLDNHLRRGLTQKDPRATKMWEKISSTLEFFRSKQEWNRFRPEGVLAVVSDFRGDNEFLATEVLNLLARRQLQYKIIRKSDASTASLRGLKVVQWVDSTEPTPEVKSRFRAFVENGGLLIAPQLWWEIKSAPVAGGILGHYRVYGLGKGRHAVPAEDMNDPYEIAVDTHMLVSRRNDLVRIFNVNACNTLLTGESEGERRLLQILNYSSSGRTDPASVWLRTPGQTASLWSLGAEEPTTLQVVPSRNGGEYQLPSISTYAALKFQVRGTQDK